MAVPTISIINFATDLTDRSVQDAIRAVNRQIREDFSSKWGAVWDLRLHAAAFDPRNSADIPEEPVQGEAVLYLVDQSHLPGALGYHALNTREKPFGFVFMVDPDEWTVTLSHEALELIIDPTVNVLVPGPDPRPGRAQNIVLHAYEVCDAVERTSYEIDGIRVSNFITQQWFAEGDALGTRNDFLGVGVPSFGATQDSHLAFFDLSTMTWEQILGAQQELARPLAARQQSYQHDRRRLENEEKLNEIIEECRRNPAPALRELPEGGLANVRGITRTTRRLVAGERLRH